jgi:GT2 family glycosyltransferase
VAPRVSIVVPCFNKRELTAQCWESLAAQTPDAPLPWEAIFIDNASSDDTSGWLESRRDARIRGVRNPENLGFAIACNQGAAVARGRYVVFLNNDTEARAGWLSALIQTLESDSSVGIAGSKLLYPDGTVQHAGMIVKERNPGELVRWEHLYRCCPADAPVVNRVREFQAVTGASLAMRRATFDALGGFDEGFVNGWEDVDLCLRVRQLGFRVLYQPGSVLVHHESQTPG